MMNALTLRRALLAELRGVEAFVEAEASATGDIARRIRALADRFAEYRRSEGDRRLSRSSSRRVPQLYFEPRRARCLPLADELYAVARACETAHHLALDSPLSIRIRSIVAEVRSLEAQEASELLAKGRPA